MMYPTVLNALPCAPYQSHLATAIGVAAIHQGKRARFFNAVDLVNQLEREKSQDKVGKIGLQSGYTESK